MIRYGLGTLCFLSVFAYAGAVFAIECAAPPDFAAHPEAAAEAVHGIDLAVEAEVTGFSAHEQCYPDKDGTPYCVNEAVGQFLDTTPYKGTVDKTVEIQLGPTNVASDATPHFTAGQKLLLAAYWVAEPQRDRWSVTPAGFATDDCMLYTYAADPISAELERYRTAWQAMERLAQQPHAPADRWRELGAFLERSGDYRHALSAYEQAAVHYPDDPDFQAARGRLLFELHRPEAFEALQLAASLGDAKSQSLLTLATAQQTPVSTETRHLDLSDLDLRHKSFVGLLLTGSTFRRTDLGGAYFLNTRLTGVDFRDANLRGAVMRNVVLRNADFTGSDIEGLQLDATNLSGAKFAGVYINLAYFDRPTTPDGSIINADLSKAQIDCDSYDADLAHQIATQQPSAILTERCRTAAGLK